MNEREAYLGFSLVRGIGPQRCKLLVEYFGSAAEAFMAHEAQLRETGLGQKIIADLVTFRADFNPAQIIAQYNQAAIAILTRADADYPAGLLEIPDPPLALYIIGTLPMSWDRAVGVVGTRVPTPYGRQMSATIASDLVRSGCLIISGLAKGVDALAHTAAVELKKPTVAVLGCGVNIIYPPEHKDLYRSIIQTGGAIISEVPPGHTVARGLFPARNRIISGLSKGIVVTEGAEDSGSLITARFAAEQGRDVFALPGPATSFLSAGPIKLIKQGAKLITSAGDVLSEYGWGVVKKVDAHYDFSHFEPMEQAVLATLTNGGLHCDEIVRASQLGAGKVMEVLTQLEISGILKNLGNGVYGLK